MDLKQVRWKGLDWLHMAEDRDQRVAAVKHDDETEFMELRENLGKLRNSYLLNIGCAAYSSAVLRSKT